MLPLEREKKREKVGKGKSKGFCGFNRVISISFELV
jgi:hypothetical protein